MVRHISMTQINGRWIAAVSVALALSACVKAGESNSEPSAGAAAPVTTPAQSQADSAGQSGAAATQPTQARSVAPADGATAAAEPVKPELPGAAGAEPGKVDSPNSVPAQASSAPAVELAQSKIAAAPAAVATDAPKLEMPAAPATDAPVAAKPADAAPVSPEKAALFEKIKLAVQTWQQGRINIDEVRETAVPGIYEVRSGTELVYVHESARHVFVDGQLVDMQSGESLTQKRLDEILMVNFDDLPLEYAIKQVNGKGGRKLAVFEDPNCGHCKNLRKELNAVDDLTIYTFTLPILAKDSESKARKAWCAADKVKAWNALMLEGKVPENDGSCNNPVENVSELAKKLSIRGTPTIFFSNGRRLPGGVPGEQLRKMIDEFSKKA